MARRLADRTQEHALAADLLFEIFKASMTLQTLTGEHFRSPSISKRMSALARDLSALRRSLHLEWASRAGFSEQSPYAGFETKLQQPAE